MPDTQTIGQRRIYFTRFEGECLLFCLVRILCLAQSVQLICNAYEHQSHVGDHGQQHLAQGLGLLHGKCLTGLPVVRQRELVKLLKSDNKSRNIL